MSATRRSPCRLSRRRPRCISWRGTSRDTSCGSHSAEDTLAQLNRVGSSDSLHDLQVLRLFQNGANTPLAITGLPDWLKGTSGVTVTTDKRPYLYRTGEGLGKKEGEKTQEARRSGPPGLEYELEQLEREPESELDLACGGRGGHLACT